MTEMAMKREKSIGYLLMYMGKDSAKNNQTKRKPCLQCHILYKISPFSSSSDTMKVVLRSDEDTPPTGAVVCVALCGGVGGEVAGSVRAEMMPASRRNLECVSKLAPTLYSRSLRRKLMRKVQQLWKRSL
jgi:hypothetical protein